MSDEKKELRIGDVSVLNSIKTVEGEFKKKLEKRVKHLYEEASQVLRKRKVQRGILDKFEEPFSF